MNKVDIYMIMAAEMNTWTVPCQSIQPIIMSFSFLFFLYLEVF